VVIRYVFVGMFGAGSHKVSRFVSSSAKSNFAAQPIIRVREVFMVRVRVIAASFLVLLSVPFSARADGDAAPLAVTAKLVEIPSKMPPDDLYDYAYVMRYEVIGGPLDKQSILVAHYKPTLPRAKIKDKMKPNVGGKLRSFVQGDVHKLKLSPDLKKIWKGAVIDDFAATDHKSVRYWCLEADPS
jgi:hypothetical protein